MNLTEKLRRLVQRPEVPEETRDVLARAGSFKEAMQVLEALLGRNEMELAEQENQLVAIEKTIARAEERIRNGGLTSTEETAALRQIERLEKRRGIVENLVAIYNGNVNLHLNLMEKIQQAEAMRLRGVSEEEIDRLFEIVEEDLARYRRVNVAAEAGEGAAAPVDRTEERKRLEAIRQRVIGARSQVNVVSGSERRREPE